MTTIDPEVYFHLLRQYERVCEEKRRREASLFEMFVAAALVQLGLAGWLAVGGSLSALGLASAGVASAVAAALAWRR